MKRFIYIAIITLCLSPKVLLADSHSTKAKSFFSSDVNVHGVVTKPRKSKSAKVLKENEQKEEVEDSFAMKEAKNEQSLKNETLKKEAESHGFTKAEIAKKVYSSTQLDQIVETIESARKNAPTTGQVEARSLEDVERVIRSAEKLSNETHKKQIKKGLPEKEKYTF